MLARTVRRFLTVAAIVSLTVPALAAPKVTVSISGDLDEMLAVLQHLRNMGFGFETSQAEEEGALRLQVDSVVHGSEISQPEQAAQSVPVLTEAAPVLGMGNAAVSEPVAKPRSLVQVTAQISDPDNKVDTVGASVDEMPGVDFDLSDNGRRGDKKAGDGVWSASFTVPDDAAAGDYVITIVAYDRYGDPVMTEDKEQGISVPLQTKVGLNVGK